MFEPSVQLEASHLEHVDGAGLTLVRRQAEAHRGLLTAAGALDGQGHLFTLRLPLDGGPTTLTMSPSPS